MSLDRKYLNEVAIIGRHIVQDLALNNSGWNIIFKPTLINYLSLLRSRKLILVHSPDLCVTKFLRPASAGTRTVSTECEQSTRAVKL